MSETPATAIATSGVDKWRLHSTVSWVGLSLDVSRSLIRQQGLGNLSVTAVDDPLGTTSSILITKSQTVLQRGLSERAEHLQQ
jgi:hypothetical protein